MNSRPPHPTVVSTCVKSGTVSAGLDAVSQLAVAFEQLLPELGETDSDLDSFGPLQLVRAQAVVIDTVPVHPTMLAG